MYGLANSNAVQARCLYQEKFANRRCPNRKTFVNIHRRHLYEYGNFEPRAGDRGRPRSTTPEEEEQILDFVNDTPEISTQQLARQVAIPYSNVWRVLRNQQLYP